MVMKALRERLRALATGPGRDADGDGRPNEGGRRAAGHARRKLSNRLRKSGEMRKPIEDANLEPGEDPRRLEEFVRGDRTVGPWFGEDEPAEDANEKYFAGMGADDRGDRGGRTGWWFRW